MRVLLACALIAVVAAAQPRPRVIFREGFGELVQTREEAVHICQNNNEHIAHEAQLIMDVIQGSAGHRACGWTWTRGRTVHVHCTEKTGDGKRCMPGKSEIRSCSKEPDADRFPPSGVYCRQFSDEEERPVFEVEDGELVEIYRASGPEGHGSLKNVNEAMAVCVGEGNTLAYWTQLSAYIERYDIQICQFSWLREPNAVFNGNCGHNDRIDWDVRDPTKGYDAICYGHIPHKYQDPCAGDFQFRNLEGIPVYCSEDGYIIIQDRPSCADEEYTFHQEWEAYHSGFGEIGKGYWFGLKYLSKLTNAYNFKLTIEVVSDSNATYVANYDSFIVDDLEDNYRLKVGEYSGSAGDMFHFIQSNGKMTNDAQFSTVKHDNDGSFEFNCAKEFGSGWWFQSCHVDNLNGPCKREEAYSEGISATRTWRTVSNNSPGLRRTRMKIKYMTMISNGDGQCADNDITVGVLCFERFDKCKLWAVSDTNMRQQDWLDGVDEIAVPLHEPLEKGCVFQVCNLVVKDADDLYTRYIPALDQAVAKHGGCIIAKSPQNIKFKGSWEPHFVVVVQWKSEADIDRFHVSEDNPRTNCNHGQVAQFQVAYDV